MEYLCPKCKKPVAKTWRVKSNRFGNCGNRDCSEFRRMVYVGKFEEGDAGGGGKETPAPEKAAAKAASGKHKAAAPAGGGAGDKRPAGRVPAGPDIPKPKSGGIAKSLREFFDF